MLRPKNISLCLVTLCVAMATLVSAQKGAGKEAKAPWFRDPALHAKKASAEERAKVFEASAKGLADSATDAERKKAIQEVLRVSGRESATPLLKVLKQRAPEKAFELLVATIADAAPKSSARRREFVRPLILALPQASGATQTQVEAALTSSDLAKTTVSESKSLLASNTDQEVGAAIEAIRLRPDGTAGVVRLLEPLVEILRHEDANLRRKAESALSDVSALELKGLIGWRKWLRENASSAERANAIADALAEQARVLEAKNRRLVAALNKALLEKMAKEERQNLAALTAYLANEEPQVRSAAIGYLAELLPNLKKVPAETLVKALMALLDPQKKEIEANKVKISKAMSRIPGEALAGVLADIEKALLRNGLSAPVTVSLIEALKQPGALPLMARLFAKRAKDRAPFGDRVELALLAQVPALAGGELSAVQLEELGRVLGLMNARYFGAMKKDTLDAFVKETNELFLSLELMASFKRDIAALCPSLREMALAGLPSSARARALVIGIADAKPAALLDAPNESVELLWPRTKAEQEAGFARLTKFAELDKTEFTKAILAKVLATSDKEAEQLRAVQDFAARLAKGSAARAIAWFDLATPAFKAKESLAALALSRGALVEGQFKALLAKAELAEADETAALAMASVSNAKTLLGHLIADLRAKAEKGKERDKRTKLLKALAAKVEGLKLDGVKLEGEKAAFVAALDALAKLLK